MPKGEATRGESRRLTAVVIRWGRLKTYLVDELGTLEAEAIHILRETAAEFERPVLLYSVGKDSSVLLHLALKAFAPARVPFPFLHVDTGYKFQEMYAFRDQRARDTGIDLRVWRNETAVAAGANPFALGTERCCGLLKTEALLTGLAHVRADAAIGGARREEERSRAKERVFSVRSAAGQWEPRRQRPELWALYNTRLAPGETMRVFPLSNWTELDVWRYIAAQDIPVNPLYFAREREVVERGGQLLLLDGAFAPGGRFAPEQPPQRVCCRFRSLGCVPCSGAVRSTATTVAEIIDELRTSRISERSTRVIDHDSDASMEKKKREGYF
jgi:sulfate adenylyltransferase subunit 2